MIRIDLRAFELDEVCIGEGLPEGCVNEHLMEPLGLPSDSTSIVLTTSFSSGAIPVVTRSVIGTMYFLSLGVEPPPSHENAGIVTVTRDETGRRFDWSTVTEGRLRIHSSDERPRNAYTGLSYRGAWFYIEDKDLESKSTFSLLAPLLALQAGEIELDVPVLTIPLN